MGRSQRSASSRPGRTTTAPTGSGRSRTSSTPRISPIVHAGINGVPTDADVDRSATTSTAASTVSIPTRSRCLPTLSAIIARRPVNCGLHLSLLPPAHGVLLNKHTVLDRRHAAAMTTGSAPDDDGAAGRGGYESVVWLGVAINFGRELTEQEITRAPGPGLRAGPRDRREPAPRENPPRSPRGTAHALRQARRRVPEMARGTGPDLRGGLEIIPQRP